MSIKVRLTWILWFLVWSAGVSAQPQLSPDVLLPDSLLFTDTRPTADSVCYDSKPVLNEDLNDFFSEKMDSLVHTWFIENAFHTDSPEINYSETFPVDLHDSVYIRRLKDAQQVIDLSYNDVVKNFIKMYTERKRGQVE
ncbi:MAG: hypothetical protein EOM73_08175, partial [Bacteroidia bacterium]|nr:hypothetical protein [Bacteroidia bacterium]